MNYSSLVYPSEIAVVVGDPLTKGILVIDAFTPGYRLRSCSVNHPTQGTHPVHSFTVVRGFCIPGGIIPSATHLPPTNEIAYLSRFANREPKMLLIII